MGKPQVGVRQSLAGDGIWIGPRESCVRIQMRHVGTGLGCLLCALGRREPSQGGGAEEGGCEAQGRGQGGGRERPEARGEADGEARQKGREARRGGRKGRQRNGWGRGPAKRKGRAYTISRSRPRSPHSRLVREGVRLWVPGCGLRVACTHDNAAPPVARLRCWGAPHSPSPARGRRVVRNKSPEQRLNLSRSWHKGHSHAYNTSFFI